MKEFIEHFTGLKRNYGYCNINNGYKDPASGKIKFHPGDYGWSSKEITDEDYIEHLKGKKSIGIQPCDDNGFARFGAIDVDPPVYGEINIKNYLDIIQQKELPLIPVKSKSGGLHLYLFTKTPVRATEIKEFLEQVLFLFKLPLTTEIFPKQTKLGSNTDGIKINGNFINLPYFNKSERKAINPDGTEMSFDTFLNCIYLNKTTSEQLKEIQNNIIKLELSGGAEEFKDGPPCLEILSKQKMSDGRDRFLYNYMVFAKKKYPDTWKVKIIEAARNYFTLDMNWTDDHIKKKITAWDKETKGHTCKEDPINSVCIRSECVKRKFGIASDKKISWPTLSGLQKIDFKPDPEFYFTVETADGESVPVHAKDINKIKDQSELKGLIMAQTGIVPPPVKAMEFWEIQEALFTKMDVVQPAHGTRPLEILKKHLEEYINGPQATGYNSFKSGNVLKDEDYAYFVYDEFFDFIKEREWKKDISRTSHMIVKIFEIQKGEKEREEEVLFDLRKRYPGKDKEGKPWPGVRGCVQIPLYKFEKEEDVEEEKEMESESDIV